MARFGLAQFAKSMQTLAQFAKSLCKLWRSLRNPCANFGAVCEIHANFGAVCEIPVQTLAQFAKSLCKLWRSLLNRPHLNRGDAKFRKIACEIWHALRNLCKIWHTTKSSAFKSWTLRNLMQNLAHYKIIRKYFEKYSPYLAPLNPPSILGPTVLLKPPVTN
jgi:hypothetical protein